MACVLEHGVAVLSVDLQQCDGLSDHHAYVRCKELIRITAVTLPITTGGVKPNLFREANFANLIASVFRITLKFL